MNDTTLDQYLDGELSDVECSQLNRWLEQDPAHVERLAERAFLHAEIRRRLRRKAIEQNVLASSKPQTVFSVGANDSTTKRMGRRVAVVVR